MKQQSYRKAAPAFKRGQLQKIADARTIVLPDDLNALPSFDGSNHILQLFLFTAAPERSKPYYFAQDSRIDSSRTTALQGHYNNQVLLFGDFDMYRTLQLESLVYNVVTFADFKNCLVTLTDRLGVQDIQRCPLSGFLSLPSGTPGLFKSNAPKLRRALDINISSNQSFIEFTAVPATALPFVVPVSLYYEPLKK